MMTIMHCIQVQVLTKHKLTCRSFRYPVLLNHIPTIISSLKAQQEV